MFCLKYWRKTFFERKKKSEFPHRSACEFVTQVFRKKAWVEFGGNIQSGNKIDYTIMQLRSVSYLYYISFFNLTFFSSTKFVRNITKVLGVYHVPFKTTQQPVRQDFCTEVECIKGSSTGTFSSFLNQLFKVTVQKTAAMISSLCILTKRGQQSLANQWQTS